MNSKKTFWTNSDLGLLLIRLVFGGLFFMHGFHKFRVGTAGEAEMLVSNGLPGVLINFVYVSEMLAPALIILGVYTRLSIMTVLITMITIFYVLPVPIELTEHGALNIESHLFFTVLPLALFFTGPGRYRLLNNKSGNWLLD